jgi:hypothetical protein
VIEAEQDPDKADPATYARQGHETLSAILASLGSWNKGHVTDP